MRPHMTRVRGHSPIQWESPGVHVSRSSTTFGLLGCFHCWNEPCLGKYFEHRFLLNAVSLMDFPVECVVSSLFKFFKCRKRTRLAILKKKKKLMPTVDHWPSLITFREGETPRVFLSNRSTTGKEEMGERNKSIGWILGSVPDIFSAAEIFLAQEGKLGILIFFCPFSTSDSTWPEQVAASQG